MKSVLNDQDLTPNEKEAYLWLQSFIITIEHPWLRESFLIGKAKEMVRVIENA